MIKPVGYRVLVEAEKIKETYGKILKPQYAIQREQKGQTKGIFLSCGKNARYGAQDISKGAAILFARYSGSKPIDENGNETEDENSKYFVINDEDILAVVE